MPKLSRAYTSPQDEEAINGDDHNAQAQDEAYNAARLNDGEAIRFMLGCGGCAFVLFVVACVVWVYLVEGAK